MTTTIKQLAIKGAVWTIVGYGIGQVLRFGSNLILTRLLFPELFGLMALVNIFLSGLALFSDVGFGINVVQNKRGEDPAFLNTLWTIQIVRGVGLWLVCLLIALPLAQLYNEPQLTWLLPIVGFTSVLNGFNSTALYSLERRMAVATQTIVEVSTQILSIIVMVVWAWFSPTIWSLVSGSLVAAVVKLIWSHRLDIDKPNRWHWDHSAGKTIFAFGRWIFISTALTFVAEQADRILLGKLFSLELLGIYGIALMLSDVPRTITVSLAGKVIFPSMAKFAELPRTQFRQKILKNRRPLLLLLTVGMAILIGFGDLLIEMLYDPRYQAAAWMLPLLALGIYPRLACATIDSALFAFGKPQYATYGNLSRFIITTIGILIGAHYFGFPGAVVAVALNDLIYYSVISYGLCREGVNVLWQDATATLLLLALTVMFIAVRLATGLGTPLDTLAQFHG